jgi:hypothetical protein
VFAATDASDQSIIVELLEREAGVADANAPAYYFAELAEANDAGGAHSAIESVTQLTPDQVPGLAGVAGAYAALAVGRQAVSKYHEGDEARNDVRVLLAVLRLPAVTTDVLVTMNVPLAHAPASSAAAGGAVTGGGAGGLPAEDPTPAALVHLMSLLASFRVVRWSLFGAGSGGGREGGGGEGEG